MENKKTKSNASHIVFWVAFCILINLIGKYLAERFTMPMWLDSIGTIFVSYLYGPVGGGVVGGTVNLMYGAINQISYHYAVVNVLVGVVSGIVFKKSPFNNRFSAFSICMLLSIVATIASLPLNMFFLDGYTGNLWGDSVINYLKEISFFEPMAYLAGEFYVDLADKLISVFLIYFLVRFHHSKFFIEYFGKFGIKKNIAKILIVAISGSLFGMLFPANEVMAAEEEPVDFSSYVQIIYNSTNGIPGGEVNDIAQTMDGQIWLGTYGGLYQYDGHRFTLMSDFDSVRNANCLFTDEEGRLWVGTNDNGVSICANNQVVNVLNTDGGLSADSVRSMVKNTNGLYYIGTTAGLNVVELSNGLNVLSVLSELNYVTTLTKTDDGYVCAVSNDGMLALVKDTELISVYESDEKGYLFTCAAFDEQGYLYAATSNQEIHKYVIRNGQLKYYESFSCDGMTNINSIFETEDGFFLVCSDTGIGYFDRKGNFSIINTNSFDSSIDNIMMDYQGNYWFTSSRLGLLKLTKSMFVEIFARAGFEETVVNTVTVWNDKFYYGTDNGLLVSDSEFSENIKNKLTDTLLGVRIRCAVVDSNNHLWLTTSGAGVIEATSEEDFVTYTSAEGLSSNKTRAALELSDGTMAIATDNGISFIDNGEIIKSLGVAEGLEISKILCLYEKDGYLFAGSDGAGIYVIKDGVIERNIGKKDGISSNIILRITEPSDKNGLIILSGTGINYISQDNVIKEVKSFPYYNNFDAFTSESGKLWVLSSAGIYVVNEKDLINDSITDYVLLDAKKGLRQNLTVNSWNYLSTDGKLFMCGDTGVVYASFLEYGESNVSYRMLLESIVVDGIRTGIEKEEVNSIGRDVVKVEFIPKVINYKIDDPYVGVWLEGFDTQPNIVPQSELENLVYTNLPSGEYVFHLAIYDNSANRIIQEITYDFLKEKEFYDNWWFTLYIFLILIIIVIYFVWLIIGSQINKTIQIQNKEIENLRLKQEADAAVAAGEAKDKFLALMSHDIRTPINAILGMNEMIIRESNENHVVDYAMDVKSAGNTLLSLVNGILDFSKIEEGKMEIIPVEYNSRVLFNNLINGVKTRAKDKNLEFRINIDEKIPLVLFGDDVRITQVISNLLTNAVKYTEKGYISLSVNAQKRADDMCALFVEVKDTGIGIKEEDMEKLFETFTRLDEKRNRNIEGTGLGMSIVTRLLKLMGSRLNVESKYGIGSIFSFILEQKVVDDTPIGSIENFSEATREKENEEHIYAPKAHILVVDDNDMNIKVVTGLLKVNGIVPDSATSGEMAIEKVKNKYYDIIFLDHMMPDMDGIQTLAKMKEMKILRNGMKVIILTANAIIGAREQYISVGFDDYLSKPIESSLLEKKLIKYLPSGLIKRREESESRTEVNPDEKKAGNTENTENTAENVGNSDILADPKAASLIKFCPQINPKTGLKYCMDSWDFYDDILKEYINDDKTEKLKKFFDEEDFANYEILAHSVKSNSLSIGAEALSAKAKALEKAAKEGDYDYIKENHDNFMDEYSTLVSNLVDFIMEQGGINS